MLFLNIYQNDTSWEVCAHSTAERARSMASPGTFGSTLGVEWNGTIEEVCAHFYSMRVSLDECGMQENSGTRASHWIPYNGYKISNGVVTEAVPKVEKFFLNIYPGKKNIVYIHETATKAIEQGDEKIGTIGLVFEGTLQDVRKTYPTMEVMSHKLGKNFEPLEEPFGH